ncbi:MAG: diguanylate cyclase [Actinophytocola sp.]|nr:diguanylate cyclase [Actinophytocola sp.]
MSTTLTVVLLVALAAGWAVTARLALLWWRRLHTDPLTGLANRDALARAFARARRRGLAVGVLLLDLDHFKAINDIWGHAAGNLVLRHVARQLAFHACSHRTALPVRLHGDEFAVQLTDLPPGAAGMRLAEQHAREVAVAIATPVAFGVDQLAVTGTVGAAVSPAGEARLGALLRVADQRMYAGKARRHADPSAVRGWVA